ncbi:hypothetical protein GDO81_023190 [Engystomops pustulosus]|uniref:Uncharacterized protein n=1 Tax=Engystomops pustulosus TaxID=76066 RepID=A0AAV6ZNK7_ENGPU|nr:hypothetical protein GDO81_023190 [Engystomops pustulosus]
MQLYSRVLLRSVDFKVDRRDAPSVTSIEVIGVYSYYGDDHVVYFSGENLLSMGGKKGLTELRSSTLDY